MKTLFIIVLNVFVLSSAWPEIPVNPLMKMSIYYETLCGDSKRFILKQLYPAYPIIKKYFNIEFVPYGKVKSKVTNGSWEFECQHGPVECWGNKVQACVLAARRSQDAEMEFINCFMSKRASKNLASACSKKAGYSIVDITQCAESELGDELHTKYGSITHQMFPIVKNVPIIVFNDQYNADLDAEAHSNLLETALKVLYIRKNPAGVRMLTNGQDLAVLPSYRKAAQEPTFYDAYEELQNVMYRNAINNTIRYSYK